MFKIYKLMIWQSHIYIYIWYMFVFFFKKNTTMLYIYIYIHMYYIIYICISYIYIHISCIIRPHSSFHNTVGLRIALRGHRAGREMSSCWRAWPATVTSREKTCRAPGKDLGLNMEKYGKHGKHTLQCMFNIESERKTIMFFWLSE